MKIVVQVVIVLAGLLVLPGLALKALPWVWWWTVGYLLVINFLAYLAYACDKRRAEKGEWRVAEAQLHLLDLLGGWPGGFLAQRRLRHKCSKGSYQVVFWLIVLAWQLVAADSLQNWKFSKAALNEIEAMSNH